MSALARYFLHEGKAVAGYDRTPSELTAKLEEEGATITYDDNIDTIPAPYRSTQGTLVVYTPAIPTDSVQWKYFRDHGFEIMKRSQTLGVITQGKYVMAVAGTHGKTSTTTMTAWFNHIAGGGGSAFLGGISKNFDSNLVLGEGNRIAVEADEFDRSFLRLDPDVAVITSVDADHLDIYGSHEQMKKSFSEFVSRIKPGGSLILKKGIELDINRPDIKLYQYSYDQPADFYAANIRPSGGGRFLFDIVCPDRTIRDCSLGIPGWINIENCVAAVSLLWVAGFDENMLRTAISEFKGVERRFDFHINIPQRIYMDDYAHHPAELCAAITSLRGMFPGRKLTIVFQPHLYTRTRDFFQEFADALSLADRVLLLPIYPAREEPIEGITSEILLPLIKTETSMVSKDELLETIKTLDPELLVTFGAGDIDRFCKPITELLESL